MNSDSGVAWTIYSAPILKCAIFRYDYYTKQYETLPMYH